MALLRAQIAMGLGLESALRLLGLFPAHRRCVDEKAALGAGRLRPGSNRWNLPSRSWGANWGRSRSRSWRARSPQARRLGVGLEETLARSEFEFAAAHERRVAAAAERAQLRSHS